MNVKVDERQLTKDDYLILPDGNLKISASVLPKNTDFVIETTVRLQPEKNLALSGLYASSGKHQHMSICTHIPYRFHRIIASIVTMMTTIANT